MTKATEQLPTFPLPVLEMVALTMYEPGPNPLVFTVARFDSPASLVSYKMSLEEGFVSHTR